MKRTDIERMISLADDRYIDEIFQDKITGKRRNIFVTFTAVAAALALVVGGISYFVSNAGNADKITADDPAVSELGIVDYSLYFQNTLKESSEVIDEDWTLETAGIFCYFSDSEYVKHAVPFDTSRFTNANCQFYYNYKDEVKAVLVHASDRTDDLQENVKSVQVAAFERGEFFPHLSLGKFKSMKRFDVDVYGFDVREEDDFIGVIFAMEDKEYYVSGKNISYDEIGIIMDSIIENGLWTDSFDLSKAEMEYGDISGDITLEEANMIMPFAGYVPQIHKFGDMRLNYNKVSYYAGRDEANNIVPQWLYFTYYDGGERDICLQYFTEDADVQPLEKTVAIDDIELDKLSEFRDDGNNHTFTIDFNNFKVNVWTNNCNDNELLNCIIAMRIGADGVVGSSFEDISLIEANNIVPFAGYVPQTDNIGGMRLVSAYCIESSFNGSTEDNSITFKYLQEETNKYITLYYTCGEAVYNSFFVESFTAEQLESIEQSSEQGDPNCRSYSFSLECGDFRINAEADCTPEEMKQCIDEICHKESKSITLAEANKIAPYEGYVPQNETAGDMKLGLVQYNGSNIVLDYSFNSENRFSYIGLTYTADKRMTADYSVITLEELINGDIVIHNDDSEDGRNNYKFAVECNGLYGSFYVCVDSEKCTTEELYDCILTTLMEKEFDAGSLEYSNNLEPFAGYVPTKQDILIYDKDERYDSGRIRPRYIHETVNGEGAVVHMHLRFYKDTKNLTLDYYVYGSDTAATVQDVEGAIPLGSVTPEIIKMFLSDGNKAEFIIGCGEFFIQVSAENCSVEEIWAYISEIRGVDADDAETQNLITMKEVRELAEKGDDLDWVDFAKYYGVEAGSGLYIMAYEIKGMDYSVTIGGVPNEKPWYIYLNGENDSRIDIRYDSVDEFLKENKDMLSLDTIKELAKKGDDLMWDDFDGYSFTEGGSGLYIRFYSVEDGYSLSIGGGGPNDKPMYIYLSGNGKERIDIRHDSVEEFLESKPFINFEF